MDPSSSACCSNSQLGRWVQGPVNLTHPSATASTSSPAPHISESATVTLTPATYADIPELVPLINEAYSGTKDPKSSSKQWTTVTSLFDTDRTSEAGLKREMDGSPEGRYLVSRIRDGEGKEVIEGCVWVDLSSGEGNEWYLGTLAVLASRQSAGLGRKMLEAAEAHIKSEGGKKINLSVVNKRKTLIDWYKRRGYSLNGKVEPFPYNDPSFGSFRSVSEGLTIVYLDKTL